VHYRFYTTDVFTTRPFGGNPLAVFPRADGLDARRMQLIAAELNLSETVFVFPPEDPAHACRLRIFTPRTELPFAGHPTVGCAHVLVRLGAIPFDGGTIEVIFEEGVGPVRVSVHPGPDGGLGAAYLWAARPPESGPEPPARESIARMLSLEPGAVLETPRDRVQALSCGVPFLFVPLAHRSALARARLQRDGWEATLASFWAPHLYVFSHRSDETDAEADVHARMFAPAMGIDEDPATGAAVTALGGYLAPREMAREGTLHWQVEQGVEMGRPSLLMLEADMGGGGIEAIRVGGLSVPMSEGVMAIPDTACAP
jgi:trans-2,3-dihydro-3-hydroxyanthranilate isomerase